MKSGFNDPIEPKVKEKQVNSPWNFACPTYDERSGCFINAGSHYGVGYKTPIGHTNGAKCNVPTMPFGRVNTMTVDEVPKKNKKISLEE